MFHNKLGAIAGILNPSKPGSARAEPQSPGEKKLNEVLRALYDFKLPGLTSNTIIVSAEDPEVIKAFPVFNRKNRPSEKQIELYVKRIGDRFKDSTSISKHDIELDGDPGEASMVIIRIQLY